MNQSYRDTIKKCDTYSNPYDARYFSSRELKRARAEGYQARVDGLEGPQSRLERELMARMQIFRLLNEKGGDRGMAGFGRMVAFALLFPGFLLFVQAPRWAFFQAKPHLQKLLKAFRKLFTGFEKGSQHVEKALSRLQKAFSAVVKQLRESVTPKLEMLSKGFENLLTKGGEFLKAGALPVKKFLEKLDIKLASLSFPEIPMPRLPKFKGFRLPEFHVRLPKFDRVHKALRSLENFAAKVLAPVKHATHAVVNAVGAFVDKGVEHLERAKERVRKVIEPIAAKVKERARDFREALVEKSEKFVQAAIVAPFQAWIQEPAINLFAHVWQKAGNLRRRSSGEKQKRNFEGFKQLGKRFQLLAKKCSAGVQTAIDFFEGILAVLRGRIEELVLVGKRAAKVIFALAIRGARGAVHVAKRVLYGIRVAGVVAKILLKFFWMLVRQMGSDFGRLMMKS